MTTIYYNARIWTMDPKQPRAWGVEVEGGRIARVLPEPVLLPRDPGITAVDLDGRLLAPGFNDCHMHILPYGLELAKADLRPSAGVSCVADLVRVLKTWAAGNLQSEWALGCRYDQNRFPGAKHPTRSELDAAFPAKPVYITQTSGHAAAANSAALKLAGITRNTPNPPGGEIVRDESGEPTGLLLESAMELVDELLPRPTLAQMTAAIRRASDALAREGITSASDLFTGWLDLEEEIAAYSLAAAEGASVRMTIFPHAPVFGSPDAVPCRREFAESHGFAGASSANRAGIRLGPIKLFSDGALTTRTAALRQPYVDGSGVGMLLHEPEELESYVWHAHRLGWQLAIHAIGDRAIELTLDCCATAQKRLPRPGARHRIEHAMLLDDALIARFREQGVIPVAQPEFVARLGDAYVLGLGEERASRLNPTASLQRAGIAVPFSSDCPVVPGTPLEGVRAACRRVTPTGRVLGEAERIGVEDAIRNYTRWAAWSTFDESETGAIREGLRADFAILSGVPDELDSLRVEMTVTGGKSSGG